MATSTIKIWREVNISPSKNWVIENISTWLGTANLTIENFQYVELTKELDIKIVLGQYNISQFDANFDYNYCHISRQGTGFDDTGAYYFIIKKEWCAVNTVKLKLKMDVLNTFGWNTDYTVTDKTIVVREHKDRFIKKHKRTSGTLSIGASEGTISINVGDIITLIDIESDEPVGHVKFLTAVHLTYYESMDNVEFECADAEAEEYFETHGANDFGFDNVYYEDLYNEVITPGYDYYIRKIDLKSEEINAPIYKEEEQTLYEQNGNFLNTWTLYYKNKDNQDTSPIECYLSSDTELDFITQTGSNTIDASDLTEGKILMITPPLNNGMVTFNVDGITYKVYVQNNFQGNAPGYWSVGLELDNGVVIFHRYVYMYAAGRWSHFSNYDVTITNPNSIEVDASVDELNGVSLTTLADTYYPTTPSCPFNTNNINKTILLTPLVTRTIYPSNTIDKTLSQNVKIINLPYCPSTITEDSGYYIIDPLWKYDASSHFFKLEDLNSRFENNVVSNVDDFLKYYETNISSINTSANRYLKDSKLFHSDYFRPKFVYDSFSKNFALEQIDYEESIENKTSTKFDFKFIMTRNIVSKFLFMFNYVYNHPTEDYENIVTVARNNEEVLYNSQYLNYIKTGYNYDLKTKERQEITGGVGLGLSIAGLIGSIALAASGYGTAIGVAGIIGSAAGIAGSAINYAKTTAQSEENIQRKLQESQRQAVSVLNADDYDLLYAYSGNKAKLCIYNISDNMKNILDDLFYYVGYTVNEQKVPDINTRYWFNFLQCKLDIEGGTSNINEDLKAELKLKFDEGVTFFHSHEVNDLSTWDIDQKKENWEVSLLEVLTI